MAPSTVQQTKKPSGKRGAAKPNVYLEREEQAGTASSKRPAFHMALSATIEGLLDEGGKTDHRFRQLLYDFSTLAASLDAARAYLASQLGLSSPQYNVAMVVANHQNSGGISVSDVARRLHVSTAFITLEAGSLENAGIIEKKPNPHDRRGVILQLTRRGEQLVQSVGLERQKVNDHMFGSLTAKDFRRLCDSFSSLLDDFSYTVRLLKSVRGGKQLHSRTGK